MATGSTLPAVVVSVASLAPVDPSSCVGLGPVAGGEMLAGGVLVEVDGGSCSPLESQATSRRTIRAPVSSNSHAHSPGG